MAAQILSEEIIPILEFYQLNFDVDCAELHLQLSKAMSLTPSELENSYGNQSNRRRALLKYIQQRLLRIPSIARAITFSSRVIDIFENPPPFGNIDGPIHVNSQDLSCIKVTFLVFFPFEIHVPFKIVFGTRRHSNQRSCISSQISTSLRYTIIKQSNIHLSWL